MIFATFSMDRYLEVAKKIDALAAKHPSDLVLARYQIKALTLLRHAPDLVDDELEL